MVADFLVKDQMPTQPQTECAGVVADTYVPLAPRNASAFDSPLDALASAETEITYLPEYYYWDGVEATSIGCSQGGTLNFAADGDKYAFTLSSCAFTRDFSMTGTGSYGPDKDRFVLKVSTTGRWQCQLNYVRTGDTSNVTGECDGKTVERDSAARAHRAAGLGSSHQRPEHR
jgi:hypothetical protein